MTKVAGPLSPEFWTTILILYTKRLWIITNMHAWKSLKTKNESTNPIFPSFSGLCYYTAFPFSMASPRPSWRWLRWPCQRSNTHFGTPRVSSMAWSPILGETPAPMIWSHLVMSKFQNITKNIGAGVNPKFYSQWYDPNDPIWLWLTVRHGLSMALVEIDGLPNLYSKYSNVIISFFFHGQDWVCASEKGLPFGMLWKFMQIYHTKVDTASCRMRISARLWTSAAQKRGSLAGLVQHTTNP